jgi:mannosyltransferase
VYDVLGQVDAVHGLYYLALRPWTAVTGDSIEAVRAFSALGLGVAAAAVVLLVARDLPLPVAVASGFATTLLPGLAWTSVEARGYAWAAALAVLATLALDTAVHRNTRRSWLVYGVVSLLACWWHLYVVVLVVAHGVAVLIGQPEARRDWTITAAGVGMGVAPLAFIAWGQRDQVAWLADMHYTWDGIVLRQFAGSYPGVPVDTTAVVVGGLLALGALGVWHLWRSDLRWAALLLATWVTLPMAVGLASAIADAGIVHSRYITFAGPAAAILATIGASALPRRLPVLVGVVALVAVVPIAVAQRAPDARPHDLRAVAEAARRADADAVFFTVPLARSVAYAYPADFARTPDLSAVTSATPDPFFDETRDPDTVLAREVSGHRIVVVGTREVPDAAPLLDLGCSPRVLYHERAYWVRLYRCPAVSPADR